MNDSALSPIYQSNQEMQSMSKYKTNPVVISVDPAKEPHKNNLKVTTTNAPNKDKNHNNTWLLELQLWSTDKSRSTSAATD